MTVESQDDRTMVRTVQEIRAGRATITVTVDAPVPLGGQKDRVYTQDEIDQYQINEEMHLGQISKFRGQVTEAKEELIRRENEVSKLKGQVAEYDRDRHTERNRADELNHRLTGLLQKLTEKDAQRIVTERALSDAKERVAELDRELTTTRSRVAREVQRAEEVETQLTESRELVSFKIDLLNQKDEDLESLRVMVDQQRYRADREKRRADTFEAKIMQGHVCTGGCSGNEHVAFVGRQALTRLENEVAELTRRIDNTRVILSTPEVTGALNRAVRDQEESRTMANAIEKALDTLG